MESHQRDAADGNASDAASRSAITFDRLSQMASKSTLELKQLMKADGDRKNDKRIITLHTLILFNTGRTALQ